MWQEKLKIIENEKRQYDEFLNTGVTRDKIINILSLNLNKIFIPEPYIDFLNKMNGFEFDGCVLYGINIIKKIFLIYSNIMKFGMKPLIEKLIPF